MCFFLPCIRCGSFMHQMCFFDAYDVAQHSKVCIKACIALCHENNMVWDWTIVDEVRNLHPKPNRSNLQWVPMQLSEKGRSESALACYPIMPGCKPQCQRYLRACMVVTAETRPHDSAAKSTVFFAKRERQYKPKRCLDAPESIVEHVVGLKKQPRLSPSRGWRNKKYGSKQSHASDIFWSTMALQNFHPSHPGQGCGDPKTQDSHGKVFEESQNRKRGKAPAHPQLWLLDAFGCNDFRIFSPFFAMKETTPCLHVFVDPGIKK